VELTVPSAGPHSKSPIQMANVLFEKVAEVELLRLQHVTKQNHFSVYTSNVH